MLRRLKIWLACVMLLALAMPALAQSPPAEYDPLRLPGQYNSPPIDLAVRDASRDRDIPVRVYLPEAQKAAAVILFSHGLGGSREGNPYLARHWCARGFAVVYTQHPGSDEEIWRDAPLAQRMSQMRRAANLQNALDRYRDIGAVLDQLEKWNVSEDSKLFGRFDMKRVGMSGHSFGAVTTQGVSGQQAARGRMSFTDPRIVAALAMSPSAPADGDAERSFGQVKIPWLLMTGTRDTSPIRDTDVENRLAVFPALPTGNKYELVLDGAEHEAFSDRDGFGVRRRNPNHHKVILAVSTAFWEAFLLENADARNWLDGEGPRSVMEKADRWQKK